MENKFILASFLVTAVALFSSGHAYAEAVKEPPPLETAEEKLARMFRAFDDPASYRQGALIVNFTPGTTKEAARAVLARYNLVFETETACGPEEAGPTEERVKPSLGKSTCRTFERWLVSNTAAVAKVPPGEERAYAERLIAEPQVVWMEPDNIATASTEKPTVQKPPQTSTKQSSAGRNFTPYIAVGIIVVIALAFLLRRKKPAA